MRTEVLILRRCCFCIPLRHGLLTWGYLKLLFSLFSLLVSVGELHHVDFGSLPVPGMIYVVLEFTTCSLYLVLAFPLIVATHKKSARLLKIYYRWEISLLVFKTLLLVYEVIYDAIVIFKRSEKSEYGLWLYIGFNHLCSIVIICCTLYILVLVRSEIFSLESRHEFRFVNHATDADCQLYDVNSVEKEKMLEHSEAEEVEGNK